MTVDARTIATYDARAQEYQDMVTSDAPDAHLRAFMEALPARARLLDLGCGPGTASAHMRNAGLLPDPVDAAPGMVAQANAAFDIGARLATFDDLDAIAAYDGVWANFSLLHAPRADLPRHLTAIRRALKPGGLFHIGMKTGTGSARDRLGRLYTYVTSAELQGMIETTGMHVTSVDTGEGPGLAGMIEPWVIMRAVHHG